MSRAHHSIRPAPSAGPSFTSRSQLPSLPSLGELGLPLLHTIAGHHTASRYGTYLPQSWPATVAAAEAEAAEAAPTAAAAAAVSNSNDDEALASSSPDDSEDAAQVLDLQTKRKVRNCVAQRTFRQRRAARVTELEKELDERQALHREEDAAMTGQINDLELEIASFKAKCKLLEDMLEQERNERLRAEMDAQALRISGSSSRGTSRQLEGTGRVSPTASPGRRYSRD